MLIKYFSFFYVFFYCFLIILFLVATRNDESKLIRAEKSLNNIRAWLLALAIVVPVYFILNAFFQNGFSLNIAFDEFHNLPHYLILFATIVTAYFIYQTLQAQIKTDKTSSFENRFFKFIDYHRDNVEKIKYRKPNFINSRNELILKRGRFLLSSENSSYENFSTGKEFFIILSNELWVMFDEYLNSYHKKNIHIRRIKKPVINFIYNCLFYGAWDDKRDLLKHKFEVSDEDFKKIGFGKIAEYSKFKGKTLFDNPKPWSKKQPYPYYTGHVNRLGNYFRNFYQAIKYIDDQKFLTPKEKYDYVKHFRAQISAYEQLMFFYNSLSDLGKSWEYENYDNTKFITLNFEEKKKLYNKLLITKYDLLRNTIFNSDYGVTHKNKKFELKIVDFYPLHCSEYEEECSISGVLPFIGNKEKICRFCFNEKYIDYHNEDAKEKIINYFTKTKLQKYNTKEDFCSEPDCKSWQIMEKIKKGE